MYTTINLYRNEAERIVVRERQREASRKGADIELEANWTTQSATVQLTAREARFLAAVLLAHADAAS